MKRFGHNENLAYELNFMQNDFEDNLIINEQNLPRSINVILKEFEDPDVVQLKTEFEKSTTSKEEASIKSIKSFDYECVGSIHRLEINSHINLFYSSEEITSLQVQSRVQESIVNFNEDSGYEEEAVGIRERGYSNQLHGGSEVICDQNLTKRARIASVPFSSSPTLRRSARLLQKVADSEILMRNGSMGHLMEVPPLISSQGTLPELRLRGGRPRKHIQRPVPFTSLSVNCMAPQLNMISASNSGQDYVVFNVIVDSGCSSHTFNCLTYIDNYKVMIEEDHSSMVLADRSRVQIRGKGTCGVLGDVYYVP